MLLTIIPPDPAEDVHEFKTSGVKEQKNNDTWRIRVSYFSTHGHKMKDLKNANDIVGWDAVVSKQNGEVKVAGEIIKLTKVARHYQVYIIPTLPRVALATPP